MQRKYEIATTQEQALSNAHHAEAHKLAFKAGHNAEGYFKELRRVAVTMGPRNCVYFVRMGTTEAVKVGFTHHGVQRLNALQNSSPVKIHLEAFVNFVDNDEAFEGEGRAHEIVAQKGERFRGEWFALSAAEVAASAKALVLTQPDKVIAAIWKEPT